MLLIPTDMTQLKALSVLQTMELVRQKHGDAAVERLKAAISSDARQQLYDPHLLPTDWVDVRHATENLIAYDVLLGPGDGTAGQELVRDVAAAQVKGVYRLLFAFTSPRALMEKAGRLWPRYYDKGESLGEMQSATSASLRIHGCHDLPKHHDWMIQPFVEVVLARTGAKEIQTVHSKCVAHGDSHCLSEFSWK
jgi:hypothetical protein